MAPKEPMPLKTAIEHLEQALIIYGQRNVGDDLPFLTVTKAFEIAVEYGWRLLKHKVEGEGLEALSPKAAVRQAAKLELIDDPETWLTAIEARNASVHDYFGIGEKDFVDLAKEFAKLARPLL